MAVFIDLLGTLRTSFRLGRASLDAAQLTAARRLVLPDLSGTVLTDASPEVAGLRDEAADAAIVNALIFG